MPSVRRTRTVDRPASAERPIPGQPHQSVGAVRPLVAKEREAQRSSPHAGLTTMSRAPWHSALMKPTTCTFYRLPYAQRQKHARDRACRRGDAGRRARVHDRDRPPRYRVELGCAALQSRTGHRSRHKRPCTRKSRAASRKRRLHPRHRGHARHRQRFDDRGRPRRRPLPHPHAAEPRRYRGYTTDPQLDPQARQGFRVYPQSNAGPQLPSRPSTTICEACATAPSC